MTTIVPRQIISGLRMCGVGAVLVLSLLATVGRGDQAAPRQPVFASPEEARQALVGAVRSGDRAAVRALFGPVARELEPADPVEQSVEFEHFSRHVREGVELLGEGDSWAILIIGARRWPFPIPLVKTGSGWRFDTAAGREEILTRRIGHNELLAINACRAYVEAQREYYALPEPDGDQLPKYAQRIFSTPGRRDGLYWPTPSGEKQSPLGPQIARAREEGYLKDRKKGDGPRPFHGYYFRILKEQGGAAPGGSFRYVINGNMVAGHALVAYPAQWGVSGVMTFIVNQRGRVYQKNLGPKTAEIARGMTAYDPDLSWKLVEER